MTKSRDRNEDRFQQRSRDWALGALRRLVAYRNSSTAALLVIILALGGCATFDPREAIDCMTYDKVWRRPVADQRTERFLGKVDKDTARSRGGNHAVERRSLPWVDWQNYWATGDE